MTSQRTANCRPAFTLVELMVAMALIIFIMYVLAEAFSAGAGAFRTLKAVGDMNERLRGVSTLLRNYLSAPHFDDKRQLSHRDFWQNGPPSEGFFRIWQDQEPTNTANSSIPEANDLDGNPSFRSTTHHLHFTVKLPGKGKEQFFRADVPGTSPLLTLGDPVSRFQDPNSNVFVSPYAELAFFLRPTGETTDDPAQPSVTGLRLHTLFFRQRLLNPTTDPMRDAWTNSNQYPEVSHIQDPGDSTKLLVNTLADVIIPARRFGQSTTAGTLSPANYTPLGDGSDVLLTDVLSFDVRVLLGPQAYANMPNPADKVETFVSLFDPPALQYWSNTTAFGTARVFDTWSSASTSVPGQNYRNWKPPVAPNPTTDSTIPMYQSNQAAGDLIRIRAIQITIRIWDSKTRQTRQTSVVVAL